MSGRLGSAGLLLLPGALAVYLGFEAGGVSAGVSAAVAVALALLLVARPLGDDERRLAAGLARAALLAAPGALTVYFSINAGGFFPAAPAFAAVLLALFLMVRTTVSESPFQGFSRPLALAAAALGLYALWTLASALWSDAPGRALLELDRVLLYLLALIAFGSALGGPSRLRWVLRGLALGIAGVCLAGLITRVLPEVWPVASNIANQRLSYPVTYWNALGLLAAVGIVLCFHFASSEDEPRVMRVLGSAALPPLAATLLFTFSRGAIAVAIVGLVTYVALGRPRALLTALLATAPTTAVAVSAAYRADLLATRDPTTPAAVAQGEEVAIAVAACIAAALIVRALLLPLDRRLASIRLGVRARRLVLAVSAALALGGAITAVVAFEVPDVIARQYDRFMEGGAPGEGGDVRRRLTDPANNGRTDHWDVALKGFERAKITGEGAGTYQVLWTRDRPARRGGLTVDDAHSLYLESLGELGAVGLVLLAGAIGVILAGVAARARGPDRRLYAAVFAASLAWAVHAGIDWDWEMPAVTLWFFAVGATALATPAAGGRRATAPAQGPRPAVGPAPLTRLVVALGWLALAATPTLVLLSQRDLDESVAAYRRDDCAAARDSALSAISVLGLRAEPYEVLGYCDAIRGLDRLGVEALEEAVERDPENWELSYGLALVRGAARIDPRPAARRALELNPFDPVAQDGVARFRGEDPAQWERLARAALATRSLIRAETAGEQEETPP